MTFRPFFFFLLTVHLSSWGQVTNNQISDRLRLKLNQGAIHSTTAGSTVEWKCINRALTNKCLVYHNDQWFSFRVSKKGTFYLNLSAQTCKRELGLQLIIIEGNPCEIKTYRILECISQIRLEDAFVKLDSLKPMTEYLVNVDGFLGDYCEFDIELSTLPKGLPRERLSRDSISAKWAFDKRAVTVKWELTDSLSGKLKAFHMYRRGNSKKADRLAQMELQRNAYGAFRKNYEWTDTLRTQGTYEYQIIGIREADDHPVLLNAYKVEFYEKRPVSQNPNTKRGLIPLRFAEHTRFSVLVYDQKNEDLLMKQKHDFDPATDRQFAIDFGPWIETDHRQFLVLIMDEYTRAANEYYFYWNGEKLVQE